MEKFHLNFFIQFDKTLFFHKDLIVLSIFFPITFIMDAGVPCRIERVKVVFIVCRIYPYFKYTIFHEKHSENYKNVWNVIRAYF
jgi:hypothetical protein